MISSLRNLLCAGLLAAPSVYASPEAPAADTSATSLSSLHTALDSQSSAMQVPVASESELNETLRTLQKEEEDLSHQVYLLRIKIAATNAKIAEQEKLNEEKFAQNKP